MTQNPSSSNPRRDEKRHCLHTSAFKGEGAQIRSSKSNSMQMRQLSGLNRRLPTGGTHAFHLLAGRVLWVRRGWREGGSRGRCCLPPSSSPAELLHCGSPLKKGGQLLCLAPPPVLAVVCVLVCVCVCVWMFISFRKSSYLVSTGCRVQPQLFRRSRLERN